jgi:5-(carboxyamino)imidazole ribonucleotide synthase
VNIGIIGGGQLGMMMAEAAKHLGHEVIGLDPNPLCSLNKVTTNMIVAEYSDLEAIKKLIDKSDVVTYEFENVDLEVIEQYKDKIPQKSLALRISRNRLIEKDFACSLGVKTPRYVQIESKKDIFVPSILKTSTGGYDGKGQKLFLSKSEVDQFPFNHSIMYICEELIDFDYEISVIATRDKKGSIVYFPIPKNTHKNGILFTSYLNQHIPLNVIKKAKHYTKIIIEKLNYIGTFTVEYFVKNNDVIFNEFAPRPHNSGHYSIEACNVSQFENHIRAITNSSLVEPRLLAPTAMLNIIGVEPLELDNLVQNGVFVHDYYKHEVREGRKMGHITILDNDIERLNQTMAQYIEAYYG